MTYKSKKQLQRLSNKQIFEDIKKYIKTSHTFYETKVPELKVMAKRLHEEYDLKAFYKVFNKLWDTGYQQKSLAIQTLQLYKDDFDLETWKFIKPKLKDIKSWDKIDTFSSNIIGEILIRNRELENDILTMVKKGNVWFKRIGIMSTIPLIKEEGIELSLEVSSICLNDKEEPVQDAVGRVLKEISEVKPAVIKKLIIKNIHMPYTTFILATENMKELRKLRDVKKLTKNNILGFNGIKNIFKK